LNKAVLALEDGTVFEGRSFGAPTERAGEVVFNTALTGYQEVFTDPSYSGQIVVLTNPRMDGKNIVFNARSLKGEIPAQGGESTLFIDGYQTPCNSGLNNPWDSGYPCWAATAFSGG